MSKLAKTISCLKNFNLRRISSAALIVLCSCLATTCLALPHNPYHIGLQVGGGNVNWGNLMAGDNFTKEYTTTNPMQAGGSGVEYGASAGLNISQYFALQAAFSHYPTKEIVFQSNIPVQCQLHDCIKKGSSTTNVWSLDDRFIIPMWSNGQRTLTGFALTGVGFMLRQDAWVNSKLNVGGHFGCGFNYQINQRYLSSLNFDYFTGNGKATEHPIDSYFPFLYSINMGLAVRL